MRKDHQMTCDVCSPPPVHACVGMGQGGGDGEEVA